MFQELLASLLMSVAFGSTLETTFSETIFLLCRVSGGIKRVSSSGLGDDEITGGTSDFLDVRAVILFQTICTVLKRVIE